MGQKRKRPGNKSVPKDFVPLKQKVGKKKLAPSNATRSEVRSKPVRLIEQKNLTRKAETKGTAITTKNLTLSEVVSQTNHHNVNVRRDAFLGIRELIQRFPLIIFPQIGHLLSSIAKSAADPDDIVRKYYRQVLKKLLQLLDESYHGDAVSASQRLRPFAEKLGLQLRSYMTHRELSVRTDALAFIELLIYHTSIKKDIIQIIIQTSVQNSMIHLKNTGCLYGSSVDPFLYIALFISHLYTKCIPKTINEHHRLYLYRVGRVSLYLCGSYNLSHVGFSSSSSSSSSPFDNGLSQHSSQQQRLQFLQQQLRLASLSESSVRMLSHTHHSINDTLTKECEHSMDHPIIQLLIVLITVWNQLKSPDFRASTAASSLIDSSYTHYSEYIKEKKLTPEIITILRKIIKETVDLDNVNYKVKRKDDDSVLPSLGSLQIVSRSGIDIEQGDEYYLVPAATRCDIIKLLLIILQYIRHQDRIYKHYGHFIYSTIPINQTNDFKQSYSIRQRLFYDVFLDISLPERMVPSDVNKDAFFLLSRNTTFILIHAFCLYLLNQSYSIVDVPMIKFALSVMSLVTLCIREFPRLGIYQFQLSTQTILTSIKSLQYYLSALFHLIVLTNTVQNLQESSISISHNSPFYINRCIQSIHDYYSEHYAHSNADESSDIRWYHLIEPSINKTDYYLKKGHSNNIRLLLNSQPQFMLLNDETHNELKDTTHRVESFIHNQDPYIANHLLFQTICRHEYDSYPMWHRLQDLIQQSMLLSTQQIWDIFASSTQRFQTYHKNSMIIQQSIHEDTPDTTDITQQDNYKVNICESTKDVDNLLKEDPKKVIITHPLDLPSEHSQDILTEDHQLILNEPKDIGLSLNYSINDKDSTDSHSVGIHNPPENSYCHSTLQTTDLQVCLIPLLCTLLRIPPISPIYTFNENIQQMKSNGTESSTIPRNLTSPPLLRWTLNVTSQHQHGVKENWDINKSHQILHCLQEYHVNIKKISQDQTNDLWIIHWVDLAASSCSRHNTHFACTMIMDIFISIIKEIQPCLKKINPSKKEIHFIGNLFHQLLTHIKNKFFLEPKNNPLVLILPIYSQKKILTLCSMLCNSDVPGGRLSWNVFHPSIWLRLLCPIYPHQDTLPIELSTFICETIFENKYTPLDYKINLLKLLSDFLSKSPFDIKIETLRQSCRLSMSLITNK